MKKINFYKFNLKNLYFIFLFTITFLIYDAFTNTYILLKNNYEERMLKNAGFCDKQGYGFIQFVDQKYKNNINENIPVINFADLPDAASYFFDTRKKISEKYIILLNISEDKFYKDYFYNFKILESSSNCYLLKKND
jgi:hypothetical protein